MPRETIGPLATERLTLRMLSLSDAAALHRFRGDPGATRFLSHDPLSAEENRRRLAEQLAQAEASTSEWFNDGWAIILT